METRQDTQIGDQGAKIKALHDTIARMETRQDTQIGDQGAKIKAWHDTIADMETKQDTQIGDQGAKIKALHDTIADMETELAKRDKMIALLNDRLIILDQLGNCVYEELNRQMAEVARLRVEITGFSDRQEDL